MTSEDPKATTTDAGIPVTSDEYSLTVGPNGPVLLHDHYLIEQMANFNRSGFLSVSPTLRAVERSGSSW
jgi:catalase